MGKFLNKIIKFSIYSLVFLLPIFWLPFSSEIFEFNKQYLVFFLISLGFLSWLAKMILIDREIRFRRTVLDIPVLLFMFFSVLSAVFSVDKISSLYGFYGRFSDNLVSILCFGVFYFLITNNVTANTTNKVRVRVEQEEQDGSSAKERETDRERVSISSLTKVFLWSVFFVVLLTLFSFFGVWQMISKFTGGTLFNRIFNPIGGSLEGLTVFLMVIAVLIVGLLLKNGSKKLGRISLGFLLFLITVLLIIIDFTAVWISLGLTLILFLAFAFWSRIFRKNVNALLIPIILLIISMALLFVQVSRFNLEIAKYNILNPPKEILLNQMTSWEVTWKTLKSSPALGSGIGTFSLDFSKFKPQSFNQTAFWQVRFDKAGNQIAEIISTQGIFGFLSWLAIVLLFLIVSYYLLKKMKKFEGSEIGYQLPLIFTFLAIFIAQFFYYQNITLVFLFWFILGMGVISWQAQLKEKIISFKDFPEMSLVFNIFLIIILLVILGSWFFAGRFYLADAKYREGINLNKLENLEKAIKYNPYRASYWISLSRSYFTGAYNEAQKPAESQDTQKIKDNFANAIAAAGIASQVSPKWVTSTENLGMLYRDLIGFAQDANKFAMDSFRKAIDLEPTNPVFNTEIGKILIGDKKTEEAKAEFEKSLQLKSNYSDAKIQLALILEQEENIQEAIKKLEEIVVENPNSTEAQFQLGRLYYNNNQIDEAISQFQIVLQLFPNHSNSLYALGIAYQKKGQKEEALKMFEKVLELNPGNQDITKKIEELKEPVPTPTPEKEK